MFARLYLVCGRPSGGFLDAALRGGVDCVQLRLKDAAEDDILEVSRIVLAACRAYGVPFILNDRPDLVEAAGADGVHLGQDDVPVAKARAMAGPDRIIGLSTHSPAQIESANQAGVDYIGVGPVYETPTKPGRPAVGLDLVRYAARHARMPFFAIGGIDAANVADVVAAGGERIAVVRALTESATPERSARELRRALEEPVGAAQP